MPKWLSWAMIPFVLCALLAIVIIYLVIALATLRIDWAFMSTEDEG